MACLQSFFPAMTKIVGTLGPKSRSVNIISGCLKAGMSGIRLLLLRAYCSAVYIHCLFFEKLYSDGLGVGLCFVWQWPDSTSRWVTRNITRKHWRI